MTCIIKQIPPTTTRYDIHFTGLTEQEAVTLRCLVSDSRKFPEIARKQAHILQNFRKAMDEDFALCSKVYHVVWEKK